MSKIDFKKDWKHLYAPTAKEVVEVDVPDLKYLMIDGRGDPNDSIEFSEAVETLFAVSYAVKFAVKKGVLALDYGVMPLEGLWWADDMAQFSVEAKSDWKWTLMILQPDFVTEGILDTCHLQVKEKKNPAAISKTRFETLSEGRCAQILHIGPFSEEGPAVEKVHQYVDARGERVGKHHEIYLSDIRRADPSRWRTVIRQPMKKMSP